MPFRYDNAPLLVQNDSSAGYQSDFPRTASKYAVGIRRPEGQFASYFRSRVRPIEPDFAKEIIFVYDRLRGKAKESAFAKKYQEALPWEISTPEENRRCSYENLLAEAKGAPKCRNAKAAITTKARRRLC
jgi:hypothetical protein